MTVQIDSLDINTAETRTDEVQLDQLNEQVATLDADILGAIELRTVLVRKLAAATGDAALTAESASFDALGSDGTVFSRMLTRIASAAR